MLPAWLAACGPRRAGRHSSRFASHGEGVGSVPPQRAGLFTSSGMGADRLLAWVERTGRRQTAQPGRGTLRFAFYGRVSTEDYQDPVTSRARQLGQAGALVAGHGQIVAHFFDVGQSRETPAEACHERRDLTPAVAIGTTFTR